MLDKYNLNKKVVIITGGGGLLGRMHAEAIAEAKGLPVIVDINKISADRTAELIKRNFNVDCLSFIIDITKKEELIKLKEEILKKYSHIDVLINNAARDPKVRRDDTFLSERFENFTLETWYDDIAVGLTGTLLCCQIFGEEMVKYRKGVIINISSDLGIIAPDQRLYRKEGIPENQQPVKPVSYSVIKHGLIGLTKYLATYWAEKGIRVNSLCPAGIYTNQSDEFVQRISKLIPMGRMAKVDEYKAAIVFLASDASSYMTGQNLIIDGGRSIW